MSLQSHASEKKTPIMGDFKKHKKKYINNVTDYGRRPDLIGM